MNPHRERFIASWMAWKVADAQLSNRNPTDLLQLRLKNSELARQIEETEAKLFSVLKFDGQMIGPSAYLERLELLKRSSLEFLKSTKVDPELWQSLASW